MGSVCACGDAPDGEMSGLGEGSECFFFEGETSPSLDSLKTEGSFNFGLELCDSSMLSETGGMYFGRSNKW